VHHNTLHILRWLAFLNKVYSYYFLLHRSSHPLHRAGGGSEGAVLRIFGRPDGKDFDRINRMDRINSIDPLAPVHSVQMDATSYNPAPDSQKILDFWAVKKSLLDFSPKSL